MSDKIEIEFQFKVGDMVIPAAVAHLLDDAQDLGWIDRGDASDRYIVQERVYRQCYNTHQIFYYCRAVGRHGGVSERMVEFTEPLIVAAPAWKTRAELKKLRDENAKKEKPEA